MAKEMNWEHESKTFQRVVPETAKKHVADGINNFRRRHALFTTAILGGLGGLFLLHPFVTLVTHLMHLHHSEGYIHFHGGSEIIRAFVDAFEPVMFPWALAFTIFGITVGIYYGLQTRRLEMQVETRSFELKESNKRLQSLIESGTINSADTYRTLVETSRDCIYHLDLNGNFLYMNSAALKKAGECPEDKRGKSVLVNNRSYQRQLNEAIKMAKKGEIIRFQYHSGTSSNTQWSETTLTPIKNHSGKVVGLLGVSRDITKNKRAEMDLRRSEERYRTLVENSPDGITVTDLKGNVLLMSHQAAKMHGYKDPREVLSMKLNGFDLIAPGHQKRVSEDLKKTFKQGYIKNIEYPLLKRDGTTFPALLSTSMTRDACGKPTGFLTQLKDITELKEAQEKIQRVADEWEKTFNSISDVIFIHDNDYNILRVNDAFASSVKLNPEDINDHKCYRIIYQAEKPCSKCPFEITKQSRRAHTEEISDQHVPPLLVTTSPLFNSEGKILGAVHVGRDLAKQKKTEMALQQSLDKLRQTLGQTVNALASLIDKRDPYTAGHQKRVARLATAIGAEIGLSEEQIEGVRVAGLIHDIGKVNVPSEILSKPSKLTKIEFEMIKTHPGVAYEILKTVEFPWPVAEAVLQHHERLDGSGYPSGLSGGAIILEAKILGVTDVVEAMASHRPYRPARGLEEALKEISKGKGVLYDSRVVEACLRLFGEKSFKFSS